MEEKKSQAIKNTCAGAGAGLLSGLLGAGGGIILVPLLRDWAGLDEKKAMATSVLCISPLCAVSVAAYTLAGHMDWQAALPYLLGGLLGGIAAGFLFGKAPPAWLRRLFGALLILGAVRQFINFSAVTKWEGFLPGAAAGAGAGVLSGFGLGGGTLLLIWMTVLGGLEQHTAQAVNLLYFLPCSAGSMIGHIRNKQIVWRTAGWVIGAGLPFALAGALFAQRIAAAPLRIGFGVLMGVIGLRELICSFGKKG